MKRSEMLNAVGSKYHTENTENGEWSYPKALKAVGKTIDPNLIASTVDGKKHQYLDLRFVHDDVSILIETKDNFDKWNKVQIENQLQAYVNYEKALTNNKIVAILANTEDDRLQVWWGSNIKIDEAHRRSNQYSLLSFEEYYDIYHGTANNREKVLRSTYELNELLHKHGINEKIRAQLVGTCLLALKHHLQYENLSTKQIISGITEILTSMLEKDLSKSEKIVILDNVLKKQNISELSKEAFGEIIKFIDVNILPYINDRNTMGQDLLNLFFTTFNKYVGKSDKNQAFTPDHIVHFMCKVVGINRNSVVLDPCCGSGSFLVRAMTEALDDCSNEEEKKTVKKKHIFGIESDENVFGLATTNMLIHGDGNSNVRKDSCFNLSDWIKEAQVDSVLMNPPYNAQRRYCQESYVEKWKKDVKEDPSKGFHYVHYIASLIKKGRMAVLLPMQCAIGTSSEIQKFKELMLQEHTLDAVFSLPPDVFHPGASANACCMVFNLGVRHDKAQQKETFFGYFKDDGFIKRKNLGRVERTKPNSEEGVWADIESHWLELYHNRKAEKGLSVTHQVSANDEWLAEAYMETDYSKLSSSDFEQSVRNFLAFRITIGGNNE